MTKLLFLFLLPACLAGQRTPLPRVITTSTVSQWGDVFHDNCAPSRQSFDAEAAVVCEERGHAYEGEWDYSYPARTVIQDSTGVSYRVVIQLVETHKSCARCNYRYADAEMKELSREVIWRREPDTLRPIITGLLPTVWLKSVR
ncbi:hypothetical protein LEM8419_03580 [Neolewinella maritima]|uniref:Uncharacterized protein n=1 Tax=Neolewinella maritima TaxID=1383882 RepID=A0ABM9B5S6_9BACT|nr:hypothetical protein LEM8419_03580 [Neolewinella maritima]